MSLQLRSELLGLRVLMSISLLLFKGRIVSACVLLTGGLFACARHDELLQLRSVTLLGCLHELHLSFHRLVLITAGWAVKMFIHRWHVSNVWELQYGECCKLWALCFFLCRTELGRGHALRAGLGAPLHFSHCWARSGLQRKVAGSEH